MYMHECWTMCSTKDFKSVIKMYNTILNWNAKHMQKCISAIKGDKKRQRKWCDVMWCGAMQRQHIFEYAANKQQQQTKDKLIY